MIRKSLAVAAAAALTVASLTGCVLQVPASSSSAPAPTQQQQPEQQQEQPVTLSDEDRYLEAAMDGITYESVPSNIEDMIVDMGYLTCDAWDEGATRPMLIEVVDSGLGNSIGFTSDAATIFVDAALNHLC